MDNLGVLEALELADEDILFCEESVASSSSLATTFSEEDDLRLGAEANSFGSEAFANGSNLKSEHQKRFIVKKETTGLNETMNKFTTISSISELLKARDYDAEELLLNLGFAADRSENQASILSRFEIPESFNTNLSMREQMGSSSISKTQEWLEKHNSLQDLNNFLESKFGAQQSALEASSNVAKRQILNRQKVLRKRWSKSRQASFDRLPHLKEEEPTVEAKSDMGNQPLTNEKEKLKLSAFTDVRMIKNEPSNYSTYNSIGENGFNLSVINNVQQFTQPPNNQSANSSVLLPGNACHRSSICQLKYPEPVGVQNDSFELEEILSNDGNHDNANKVESLLGNHGNHVVVHSERKRRQGVVINSLKTSVETTPTSITSETSSGFCEPYDIINNKRLIEHPLTCTVNFKTIERIDKELDSYCEEKSKIICASAIASALLYQRNILFFNSQISRKNSVHTKHQFSSSKHITKNLSNKKFSYSGSQSKHVSTLKRYSSLPQLNLLRSRKESTFNTWTNNTNPLMSSISEVSSYSQAKCFHTNQNGRILNKENTLHNTFPSNLSQIETKSNELKHFDFHENHCPECSMNLNISLGVKTSDCDTPVTTLRINNNNNINLSNELENETQCNFQNNLSKTNGQLGDSKQFLIKKLSNNAELQNLVADFHVKVNGHS